MFLPGALALWAAALALLVSIAFYIRSAQGKEGAQAWARQFYALATFAIVVATAALLLLILRHDFRFHYVYSYSDRSLPLPYLISTLWAGQEGSFLLWLLCAALIGLPLLRYARHYENRTMIVYSLTMLSLLAILLRQSPFRPLEGLPAGQAPFDGQGLNPLLQNPWMTIHPPIMFLGYAATAVPFAFAVAALLERRYDEWVRASLPWALLSVVTLGCAILLGGYWAYVTLGWGGYWGWDPVENSSLVPWIASAALIHGMLLQRARGRFRKLNFVLAILAYVLVVYATFLTRSGVLADFSVHSFVDLGITGWLVANLVVFIALGFGVLLWRAREIPGQPGDEPLLSRTIFFVLAIATLLGTAAMVLLGTSAPLITRLASQPSQVSPAFYNRVTLPIGIVLAVLLGLVPYLQWRGSMPEFRQRTLLSLGLALAATGIAIAAGASGVLFLVFLFASLFAFFANLAKTIDAARRKGASAAGGYLAHVGLGLMLAGIITSSAFGRTEKAVLTLGEGKQVLGRTLTFRGPDSAAPGARDAMLVEVLDSNGAGYVARPRMFKNERTNQLVANPDVKMKLTHDVYISPIEFDPGQPPTAGSALELSKGKPAVVGPYTIVFQGFEMAGRHSEGGQITIGARLTVTVDGQTLNVTPVLTYSDTGFVSTKTDLPGRPGASLRLVGVNANEGRVRIELEGATAGVAMSASLRQGETLTYRGVAMTFDSFDLSDFAPQSGKIHIGAVFKTAGGEARAFVRNDVTGERFEDAPVPGLPGVTIRVARMNADQGTIEALILDPEAPAPKGEPMRLAIDFSIKPMIALLWIGLLVLLLGGLLAMVRRGSEFATTLEAPVRGA